MKVPPIQPQQPQPTFGIYKGSRKTPYGDFTWGVYKNNNIEVYDAYKYNQKFIYISEAKTLKWVKSKFTYMQDKVKRVIKSES